MGNIGGSELLVLFVVALVLLGPKRLPEIGEALGRGMRRFRQASREIRDELDVMRDVEDAADERPSRKAPAADEADRGPRSS